MSPRPNTRPTATGFADGEPAGWTKQTGSSGSPLLVDMNEIAIDMARARMVHDFPDEFPSIEAVTKQMDSSHPRYQDFRSVLLENGWRQPR